MNAKPDPLSEMEKPPEFSRRVVMPFAQMAGFAMLLVLPLLALCGLLGDRKQTMTADSDGLAVEVVAPLTARFRNKARMQVHVSASPALAGRRVTLTLAKEFIGRFGDVSARPEATGWTAAGAVFEHTLSGGAETWPILIELTPEKAGWARGTLSVAVESGPGVELKFKTLVLP